MASNIQGQRHDRSALILYGSETGNSQDVAEELGRMAERLRFATRVSEMDLVEINLLLKYTIVIFVVSTTGQGEIPSNARKFWKSLLRKRLPLGCLGHVSFTTFGLGDSSYSQFNFAARKLHKRLVQLGAKEFYPRGEADERNEQGIDGTFLSWSIDIRKHLLSLYPLPDGEAPIPQDVLLPPKFVLELDDSQNLHPAQTEITEENDQIDAQNMKIEPHFLETSQETPDDDPIICDRLNVGCVDESHDTKEPFPPEKHLNLPGSACAFEVTLVHNHRVTPESHWQDVRELTFECPDDEAYNAGDVLNIWPKNFSTDVQALIDLQGWNDVADKIVRFFVGPPDYYHADNLISRAPNLITPRFCTLRDLLIHSLDINAIPKRFFFELIALHTDDLMHQERLREFTNPAFTDEFFDYTSRPRRGILEVLQDFPSVKLPWQQACQFFPPIRQRKFSICSGGVHKTFPNFPGRLKIQLLVAIVKYRTVLRKVRQGLCSRYLAAMPAGTKMLVSFSDGGLGDEVVRAQNRMILIGAGTGIAPLRSILLERARDDMDYTHVRSEESILFFGNRNKHADFFYHRDWETMPSLKISHVFTAFSRDQEKKIYIQDVIRREQKEVWRMIEQGAIIVVCGSSGNMPKAVREAIIYCMLEEGGTVNFPNGRSDVERDLKMMEKGKKYVQETW